jgi:hypothetical protein
MVMLRIEMGVRDRDEGEDRRWGSKIGVRIDREGDR